VGILAGRLAPQAAALLGLCLYPYTQVKCTREARSDYAVLSFLYSICVRAKSCMQSNEYDMKHVEDD
jgi:hypothetical protein